VLPVFIGLEVLIWVAGLVALWRVISSRKSVTEAALKTWPVGVEEFALGVIFTVGAAWGLPQLTPYLSTHVFSSSANTAQWREAVQAAAFQLGLLGGALGAGYYLKQSLAKRAATEPSTLTPTPAPWAKPTQRPLLAGMVTFLIAIPVINGIGVVWKAILMAFGLPVNEQDMVGLFRDCDNPALWLFMLVLATIVAPLTEELVFRAGLFRFFHSRFPRGFALTLPALIFAALHGNVLAVVPLFALGVFFALAYERTGRISVTIVAHALFNLHTILLVMNGATD
jgi:uncharacterized protein